MVCEEGYQEIEVRRVALRCSGCESSARMIVGLSNLKDLLKATKTKPAS